MSWQAPIPLKTILGHHQLSAREAIQKCLHALDVNSQDGDGFLAACYGRQARWHSLRDKSASLRTPVLIHCLKSLMQHGHSRYVLDFANLLFAAGRRLSQPELIQTAYQGLLSMVQACQWHSLKEQLRLWGTFLGDDTPGSTSLSSICRETTLEKLYDLADDPLALTIPSGMDPLNVPDPLDNALCLFVQRDRADLAFDLLKSGYPLLNMGYGHKTALHLACASENREGAIALISFGLAPALDLQGQYPIDYCTPKFRKELDADGLLHFV